MRVWSAAIAGALVLVSCGGVTSDTTTTSTEASNPPAISPPTTAPLVAGCPDEGEFSEGGTIGRAPRISSDSDAIGAITWVETEFCETFSFAFETSEGAPATTPPNVDVEYLQDLPVIRIHLDTTSAVITDQLVETSMVDRIYVVRALDGAMFVDLHLAAPAQARMEVSDTPARLTVNLQPGIVDYLTGPTYSDSLVLIGPIEGSEQVSPVVVEGYARTFESNVMVLATADGQLLADTFTTAADSLVTWGEFKAELALGPGEISLFAGDENQEEGGLEGVAVDLTVR